jgi:hypothetical protein
MQRSWVTIQLSYEGFPLFLRRPTNVDTAIDRERYSTLAVIIHEFTKRLPDGRPDPDYNEGLFEFDGQIVASFDATERGVPVLVETFSGKRRYYFYVKRGTEISSIISAMIDRYPNEKLSWEVRPDPTWSFLDKYAKEFF